MGCVDGLFGFGGAVLPFEDLERAVVERLDSEAEAVDADAPELFEERLCALFGIGFDGNFAVNGPGESAAALQHAADGGGAEERRGAAAEVDRDDLDLLEIGLIPLES